MLNRLSSRSLCLCLLIFSQPALANTRLSNSPPPLPSIPTVAVAPVLSGVDVEPYSYKLYGYESLASLKVSSSRSQNKSQDFDGISASQPISPTKSESVPLPAITYEHPNTFERSQLEPSYSGEVIHQDVPSQPIQAQEPIQLRQGDDAGLSPNLQGSMSLEVQQPDGEVIHIDINSGNVVYNTENQTYVATDDVYLVIPEKNTEVLAEKVIYDIKAKTMIAEGDVYVIDDGDVIANKEVIFDMDRNISFHNNLRTVTPDYNLIAESVQRHKHFTILENGRILINNESLVRLSANSRTLSTGLRLGQGSYAMLSAHTLKKRRGILTSNLLSDVSLSDTEDQNWRLTTPKQVISPRIVENADYDPKDVKINIDSKNVIIDRKPDGFDEIHFEHSFYKVGDVPLFYIPDMEFGYIKEEGYLAYLGPEFGNNLDYGGTYLGPGYDFRMLNGWGKITPFVSYGEGRRNTRTANNADLVSAQPGIGIQGSYLSKYHRVRAGYNTTLSDFTLLSRHSLFGRQRSRLTLAYNQRTRNGFFNVERPRWLAEVSDYRSFNIVNNHWRFETYTSAGFMEDEFFPFGRRGTFVTATSAEPITTSRIQLQTRLLNTQSLVQFGDNVFMGLQARTRSVYYGTGDLFNVLSGGPYANILLGPTFSQVQFNYNVTSGDTPFVFDAFYEGSTSLGLINTIDITKYINIGAQHVLNLQRDNARNDLVIARRFFISFGPEGLKFLVGYDPIQQTSFFGMLINPEGGDLIVNFDRFNLIQPSYYTAGVKTPIEPVVAPKRKK